MKTCPNCRMETRPDAEWCWHCGYSYEDAEARARTANGDDWRLSSDDELEPGPSASKIG